MTREQRITITESELARLRLLASILGSRVEITCAVAGRAWPIAIRVMKGGRMIEGCQADNAGSALGSLRILSRLLTPRAI